MADLRTIINEALMSFACQHTVQDDGDGGMPLLDMLTPKGDQTVKRGFEELEQLTDHIVGALIDAGIVPRGVAPSRNPSRGQLTAMVDAAMVEMSNIHPPLRRSECERLIGAALGVLGTPRADPNEAFRRVCEGPRVDADQRLRAAAIGTKAPAFNGGAWLKTEQGWQWNGHTAAPGSTFPRPGGDWTGDLIPPLGVKASDSGVSCTDTPPFSREGGKGGE